MIHTNKKLREILRNQDYYRLPKYYQIINKINGVYYTYFDIKQQYTANKIEVIVDGCGKIVGFTEYVPKDLLTK